MVCWSAGSSLSPPPLATPLPDQLRGCFGSALPWFVLRLMNEAVAGASMLQRRLGGKLVYALPESAG
jgi:hypothetical protein